MSVGDTSFQGILVNGAKAMVVDVVLSKLVADVGGQGETEVVQFNGVGVAVVWLSRESVGY